MNLLSSKAVARIKLLILETRRTRVVFCLDIPWGNDGESNLTGEGYFKSTAMLKYTYIPSRRKHSATSSPRSTDPGFNFLPSARKPREGMQAAHRSTEQASILALRRVQTINFVSLKLIPFRHASVLSLTEQQTNGRTLVCC